MSLTEHEKIVFNFSKRSALTTHEQKPVVSWSKGEICFQPISSFVCNINYQSKYSKTIEGEEKIASDRI